MEKAVFAAGCFWGVEQAFMDMKGVTHTRVGYAGGHTQDPTYEQVCSDTTGHAEAVEVTFDPAVLSYEALVRKFFTLHDPTTLNRQGPDVGSQYRSGIFYLSEEQKETAKKVIADISSKNNFVKPVVTEVVPFEVFYEAEDYHQQYLQKRGGGVCH